MGAKYPGKKGGGRRGSLSESTPVNVSMTVGVVKSLLASLTSGTPLSEETAKIVALAAVRSLSSAAGTKKTGKKTSGTRRSEAVALT